LALAVPIDADSATAAIKQKNLQLIVLCIKSVGDRFETIK
jgi:hypothetical protein